MRYASGFSWADLFRRVYHYFQFSLSTAKEIPHPELGAGSICSQAENEAPMKQVDYKEALVLLRGARFSTTEIERLARVRRERAGNKLDQASADRRRLEFVRWLVATGRLTDSIS